MPVCPLDAHGRKQDFLLARAVLSFRRRHPERVSIKPDAIDVLIINLFEKGEHPIHFIDHDLGLGFDQIQVFAELLVYNVVDVNHIFGKFQ